MSLGEGVLTLYALLVVAGFAVLLLVRAGLVRLPAHVVGALIVVLAVLIVVGVAWLLLAGAVLGWTVPAGAAPLVGSHLRGVGGARCPEEKSGCGCGGAPGNGRHCRRSRAALLVTPKDA